MKGRVTWWNKEMGYGFIEYNDNESAFVHLKKSDLNRISFHENQEIEFQFEDNTSVIEIQKLQMN
jgi:cold shock CspA family protein